MLAAGATLRRGRELVKGVVADQSPIRGLGELRDLNRRRVMRALLRPGDLSQADIARVTHLSRATVSSIVRDLREEGVVEERVRVRSPQQVGRPGVGLRLKRPNVELLSPFAATLSQIRAMTRQLIRRPKAIQHSKR